MEDICTQAIWLNVPEITFCFDFIHYSKMIWSKTKSLKMVLKLAISGYFLVLMYILSVNEQIVGFQEAINAPVHAPLTRQKLFLTTHLCNLDFMYTFFFICLSTTELLPVMHNIQERYKRIFTFNFHVNIRDINKQLQ